MREEVDPIPPSFTHDGRLTREMRREEVKCEVR